MRRHDGEWEKGREFYTLEYIFPEATFKTILSNIN